MLLKNAKVFDENLNLIDADILTQREKIAAVAASLNTDSETFDLLG